MKKLSCEQNDMTDPINNTVENYLYPVPQQDFATLKEWLHEVRATPSLPSKWDDEEFVLWVKNLWFTCWQDVLGYLRRGNLQDKFFAWGTGKYWCSGGRCTLAERPINE
jgi:hypothetical protein